MSESVARPPQVTVRKTRLTILEVARPKATQVEAVVERNSWIAVATFSAGGEWSIRASYLNCTTSTNEPSPDKVPAPDAKPAKSIKPEFLTLATGAVGSPAWLDISSDGVLVAAMRNGGIRMFMLVCSMPPVLGCNFYEMSCQSFPSVYYAKFIAPASDEGPLVLSVVDTITHTVAIHKRPLSTGSSVQSLIKAPLFDITDVQAAEPGKVIVLSCKNKCIYLLLKDDDHMFRMRTMPLAQFDGLRPGLGVCNPTSVAIGNQLVAVGYCCTGQDSPGVNGLVEAFSLETGEMLARRSVRGSHPVALKTNGPRVLVGGASVEGSGQTNPLYVFGVHDECNYSVATHMPSDAWCSAKISLGMTNWAYTQRVQTGDTAREGLEIVWETVQASLSGEDPL